MGETQAAASKRAAVIQLVVVPTLFYLGVKLSLVLAVMPEVVVMLWLPNSLLLATLLKFGYRRYGYLAVLIVGAEIAADYPTFAIAESFAFGAINVMEVTIAYALLRLWRFDARFATPQDIVRFLGAGPLLAAGAAAACAAAVYRHFHVTDTTYLQFLRIWWFSDATGLLMLTPLILAVWRPGRGEVRESVRLRWFDAVVALVACGVAGLLLLSRDGMLHAIPVRPVWLFPLTMYAAARFPPRVGIMITAGLAGVLLWITRNGQQPYGALPTDLTVLQVQQFVLVMGVTSLGLAALLAQLRTRTQELETRVADRTAELRAANEQLQKLAITDPLTSLLNRRALLELLAREIERSARHGHPLAVVIFDVDRFKNVNDEHGHAFGDEVLRHVALVTGGCIRSTDSAARYGGEEFVLIAPETDELEAERLAERVRVALAASEARVDGLSVRVTASFGVAVLREGDGLNQILARADAALYAAKNNGRNTVVVYRPPLAA